MVSYEADVLNKNDNKIDFVSPIGRLFRDGLEGAIKMIIGTKTDLLVAFLCMKLLLNSTYPMIHSSIIIICYIWYCTVFSGKLAMTTGHDMLINLHLFECKSLKTCIAWSVDFRKVLHLCLEGRNFQGSNFLKSKEFVEVNTIRIFSWASILCKVFSYSDCTFPTSWTGVLGVLYVLMWWKAGGGGGQHFPCDSNF
jgi:hypothetical protein